MPTEYMPDRVPQLLPHRMPEYVPDRMPEYMPDRLPQCMLDRMPDRRASGFPQCTSMVKAAKVIFLNVFPGSVTQFDMFLPHVR